MRSRLGTAAAAWVALAACNARGSDGSADSVRGDVVGSAPADWRRGATCYEVFVRSYFDSDGDGIGDLRGLTQKLDYINDGTPGTDRDLGAQCIWLMPVAESPTYHGYDATNYYRVEPDYGTNADFKAFAAEAHRRGIAVIVDMVLNHLSSEHPYFQEALGNPGAAHRGWFRWSARKPNDRGPWGQDVWHRSPRGSEYYYGTFWHTMPDLDYGSPAVRDEAKRMATFWLTEMGADGFRLDAVPYLVEEGAAKIGTAGTHAFLREYAAHVRSVSPNAFTVGEVWDGIDRMLPYYPDQLESYFAFDLADTLVAAIRAGSAAPLMRRVLRFQREVPNGRWATFVRNHDQTRTLTALAAGAEDVDGLARAKMAATLLLTLPGLPFVYYGEEIGMMGDKPDELLRTPMPWDATPNAGFTRGTPWQPLQASWPTTNVAAQHDDSASLLSVYRRLIHLRARIPALGGGDFAPFVAGHDAVAAYLRRNGESIVLVVANVGSLTRSDVTLTANDSVLTPGEYAGHSLLGGAPAATLTVAADGRVRGYVPLGAIRPLESHIFALERAR